MWDLIAFARRDLVAGLVPFITCDLWSILLYGNGHFRYIQPWSTPIRSTLVTLVGHLCYVGPMPLLVVSAMGFWLPPRQDLDCLC